MAVLVLPFLCQQYPYRMRNRVREVRCALGHLVGGAELPVERAEQGPSKSPPDVREIRFQTICLTVDVGCRGQLSSVGERLPVSS